MYSDKKRVWGVRLKPLITLDKSGMNETTVLKTGEFWGLGDGYVAV